MHVLVVEDDRPLADLLRRGLLQEHYTVDVAYDGNEGWDRAGAGIHDALVLDVMLPALDGLSIARGLRQAGITVPILMLTARDALHDRLRGFESGADDYLAKPFALEELLARLRAITRRSGGTTDPDRLEIGEVVLDRRSHTVMRAERPIELRPKEFALLEYLMRHPGQVLSRTLILDRVWDYGFDAMGNVVDATILRLRKAIDEDFERPVIGTVRGVGYKFNVPAATAGASDGTRHATA